MFTEKSLKMKHDMIEKIIKDIEDEFESDDEDELDGRIVAEVKRVNQLMDPKRLESKQHLRNSLNLIIQNQALTFDEKFHKLIDDAEIEKLIGHYLI